jgi:catechol 2,3-dioxygenase-like lactoylglutathione lyase family enzyme
VTLFMTELLVSDLTASAAWYRSALGLEVVLTDSANGFALMADESGGRVALKVGSPAPAGVALYFEVADLDAELARLGVTTLPTTSPEGYRRAFVADPDGYQVGLFEWVRPAGFGPVSPPA